MELYRPPELTGKYIPTVLKSRWLTAGPMCERFREAVAERLQVPVKHIALAARATSGFQAVLDMVGHGRQKGKDAWYTNITNATFVGMKLAIQHAEGVVYSSILNPGILIRTDIGGRRFSIDDEDKNKMGAAAGSPFTKYYIHDACHSWLPDPAADFAVLSCYPTKPVPGAEGGVVVCKSEELAREVESWVSSGLTPAYNPTRLGGNKPSVPGRESHLTDVAAAFNLEALEQAPAFMERLARVWRRLAKAADSWGVPYRAQDVRPYLFQVETEKVNEVRKELKSWGVPTSWNFPPAPLVTLPCHPDIGEREANRIIQLAGRALAIVENKND